MLATDGSSETPLAQGPKNDTSPVWSADGAHVLFLSDRTGTTALWSVAVGARGSTDAAVLVKSDVGTIQPLGVTREGTLFYHVPGASRQNVYVAELNGVGAAGSPALATRDFVNANFGPTWSRDGRSLAYYSQRNPAVLVIRTVSTGEEYTVPLPVGVATPFAAGPKWFPDNRSVLVLSRDAQGSGVGFYRLTLDTGATDLLWRIGRDSNFLSSFDLSPDGNSVFGAFQNSSEPGAHLHSGGRILRYDLDSHREVELKKGEWFITLAVSPDGSQLAYLKSIRENTTEYPSALEVMPTAGGPSREVYRNPVWLGGDRYNALTWTPDQRSLLFIRSVENTESILWRVPVAGGTPEKAGISLNARINSPSVHPDGKRIAFAARESDNNEVWALENFLPAQAAKR